MSNSFGIPEIIEKEIRERDKLCVYCHKKMITHKEVKLGLPSTDEATIEHLNHLRPFYWNEGLKKSGLVICCRSCNSSRGKKDLLDWLTNSQYCKDKKITINNVATPVKQYLRKLP